MSFSLDLSKAIENIKEDAENVVKGTLFSLSGMIIKGTPVGNPALWKRKAPKGYIGGTLRGAWQASLNVPDLSKVDRKDKTGAIAIADMSRSISSFKIGDNFYLVNAQPYAMRVEYGWSSQRPKGMVRVALMQAQSELNRLSQ